MNDAAIENLQTPRLLLRKLRLEDAQDFFDRLGGSAAVTEHMLWVPHESISQSIASIRKVLTRYEAGSCFRWAITLRSSAALIGIIDLLGFDEDAGTCSFAYMLGQDFWGQGYGTEAVMAVFEFAFSVLKVDAIIADHFAENPASGAVMRKAGMHYVQTIPDKYVKNGIRHDAVEYRITKEEWEQNARR